MLETICNLDNMAPHAESEMTGKASNGGEVPVNDGAAPLEPGVTKKIAEGKQMTFPRYEYPSPMSVMCSVRGWDLLTRKCAYRPPKFTDKYEERDYLKGRLAAAFRIFGKFGFDEGVAGRFCMAWFHSVSHSRRSHHHARPG